MVVLLDVRGLYADSPWLNGRGYAGHYVLLVGVEDDCFLVKASCLPSPPPAPPPLP